MLNKVFLIGNIGKELRVEKTATGSSVIEFPLATDETRLTSNGDREEKTTWHDIVAFGKLADSCIGHLGKGDLIYIEGKIKQDKFERNGRPEYRTKILAEKIVFLNLKR